MDAYERVGTVNTNRPARQTPKITRGTNFWLHTTWGLLILFFGACAITGLVLGAVAVAELDGADLSHLKKITRGLSSHATVPGSNPTKHDINVEQDLYVGRDGIFAGTIYGQEGVVVTAGGGTFNDSLDVNYGNIVAQRGGLFGNCSTELATVTVDPQGAAITKGQHIGLVDGYAKAGFYQSESVAAVADISEALTSNIQSFPLSSTRSINLFVAPTTDYLMYQLVVKDEHTLEETIYTANPLLSVAITTAKPFYGIGVDGDDSRFLVLYSAPGVDDQVNVVGVHITALSYPTFTATVGTPQIVSAASQTSVCPSFIGFMFPGGTTYYAMFVQEDAAGTDGLNIIAFTFTAASLSFTMGSPAIIDATTTTGSCFYASAGVVTTSGTVAYVAISYGGGSTSTIVYTNAMICTGLAWTAINAGNKLTVVPAVAGSRHQVVILPGGTQYGVAVVSYNAQEYGSVYTYSLTIASPPVPSVLNSGAAAIAFASYNGYFDTDFYANGPFNAFSLGGNSTYQKVVVCWQTGQSTGAVVMCQAYILSNGAYSTSYGLIALNKWRPSANFFLNVKPVNDTQFSYVYTSRAFVSGAATQPIYFGTITLTADAEQMNANVKPETAIAYAYADAEPGETLTVMMRGCMYDPDLFPYEAGTVLCLHGDGSILPNSYVNVGPGITQSPPCTCLAWGNGVIRCEPAWTRSTKTPFHNLV